MSVESLSRDDLDRMVRVSPQQFIQSLESDTFRHSLGKILSSMSSGDVKNLCFNLNPHNNTSVNGGFRAITDPQCLNMLEYLQNTRINLQNNPHYQIGSFAMFEQEREGESLKERIQRLENKRKEKEPRTLKAMNEQLMHWHVRAEISLAQVASALYKVLDGDFHNMSQEEHKVIDSVGKETAIDPIVSTVLNEYQKRSNQIPSDEQRSRLRMAIIQQSGQLDEIGMEKFLKQIKILDPMLYQEMLRELSQQQLMENGRILDHKVLPAFASVYHVAEKNNKAHVFYESAKTEKITDAIKQDAETAKEKKNKHTESTNDAVQRALSDGSSAFRNVNKRLSHDNHDNRRVLETDIAGKILEQMNLPIDSAKLHSIQSYLKRQHSNMLARIATTLNSIGGQGIKIHQDESGVISIEISNKGKSLFELSYNPNGANGNGSFTLVENNFDNNRSDENNLILKAEHTISFAPTEANLAALEQNVPKNSNVQEQNPLLFGNGNMHNG